MARTPSAPVIPEQASAIAASVLPGVALPAWAQAPAPAAPPAPEPETARPAEAPAAFATAGAPQPAAPAMPAALPAMPAMPAMPAHPEPDLPDYDDLADDTEPYSLADLPATAFPPGAAATHPEPAEPPTVSPELLSTSIPLPGHPYGAEGIEDVLPATHHAETDTHSGRRVHPLILVLGIVALLAVGAFAAFVTPGFLVSQTDDEPAGQVVVPAAPVTPQKPATPAKPDTKAPAGPDASVVFRRTDGFQALTSAPATRLAALHEQRLAHLGVPGGIAFGYAKKGDHNQVVAVGPKPTSGPVATPAAFLTAWQKAYGVKGAHAVKTGAKGVVATCGVATYRGHAGSACAIAGPQAFGTVWMPRTRPAVAAATIPGIVASIHVE